MNVVIIEDEEIISKVLENKIRKVADDIRIQAILPSLKTARRWFAENAEPDILFMDIQLSDGISFEIFNHFSLKCPIVFTTAYDEYAVQAFKVNGVDYLLKPVNEDELLKAINKCKAIIKKDIPQNTDITAILQSYMNKGGVSTYKEKFIVNIRNNEYSIHDLRWNCHWKFDIFSEWLLT